MIKFVIDLTSNEGVSFYLKHAIIHSAKNEGFSFKLVKNPVIGIKESFRKIIRSRNISEHSEILLCLLKLGLFAFKIISFFFYNREKFLSLLLSLRSKNILIGDCILSSYQRNIETKIILEKNLELYLFLVASYFSILINIKQLEKHINANNVPKYFICHETTGLEEVLRRYCLKRELLEIRYSSHHKGIRLFSGFDGVALKKQETLNAQAGMEIQAKDIKRAKEKLTALVNRTVQYQYLRSVDIDLKITLGLTPTSPKKTVIIFLATLSDAQYLYGIGPFPSLDIFHESLLLSFLDRGYDVVIKPHPAMLKNKDYAVKDRAYYKMLLDKWDAYAVSEHLLKSRLNDKLIFVSEKLSVKELSKTFPYFLCITQHGSVAAECAHLGHLSLVANNSQFSKEDEFVQILKSAKELQSKIDYWVDFKGFTAAAIYSIYRYIFIHHFFNKPMFGNEIFSDLVPEDLETSEIEVWLKDFENSFPDAKTKLRESAEKNILKLNNKFSDIIVNE